MLVHSVFFWLRPDLSEAQRTAFAEALHRLEGIPSAHAVYVGTPAATPARPVIDASYDFALTVILKDLAAHDAYQADERHQDFLANHKANWSKVVIYDAA